MRLKLKPYTEYKDSGLAWLGDIPAHWDVSRIKTVFREKDERSGHGRGTLLSLTRKQGLIPQSEATNRLSGAEDLSKYKVCFPDELVMNRMQAWSGMFAVSRQQGLVSPDYSVFRADKDVEVSYFEYLFKTPSYVDQFAINSRGIGSGFNRLYTPDFGAISLIIPSRKEQESIIRFFVRFDRRLNDLIRTKLRLIKLLNEQKQAIIHRAVTRGLDRNVRLKPSGVNWLGDVPEHWTVWQIGYFAKVGNGSTPSRSNNSYWAINGFPWLNSGSVNQGIIVSVDQFVTTLALKECHLPVVMPGSILVAITGQGKTRGTSAILGIEATINQHIAYITPKKRIVSSEYLRSALTGVYNHLRAISDDSGSTKGALTCEDLKHFRVALPPLEEQAQIVSSINSETFEVEATLERVHRQIGLLREYRTRLVADVVTGKLDVREAAARLPDEVEEPDTLNNGDALSDAIDETEDVENLAELEE